MKKLASNTVLCVQPLPQTIVSCRDKDGKNNALVVGFVANVSLECSVVDSTMPGTHELFIGKVEAIHVDEEYLDANGNILWDKMDLM